MIGGVCINQIYSREQFNIYKCKDSFILHNIEMPDFAHTHLNNYSACLKVIDLSLKLKIPNDLPPYLIISLIRVNNNSKYLQKLNELLENKKNKQEYCNNMKGKGKN